jgi:REP element-mobilizing transposase RayT
MKQTSIFQSHWQHRFSHGGALRNQRAGRGARPLSTKDPLHLVLKIHRESLGRGSLRSPQRMKLISQLVQKYSRKFFVKIEQITIQGDHLHLLIRTSRRSFYQHFFRVLAGQISQQFSKQKLVTDTPADAAAQARGLWKHRPFSRVIKGWRSYKIVRDYIQLNEQEASRKIPYRKSRLRGLLTEEWLLLWASDVS